MVVAAVLAAMLAGTAVAVLWGSGCFLPSWARWETGSVSCDLDGDGADEEVTWGGRWFTVSDDGHPVCGAERGWLVSAVAVGDIDRDGTPELVSLVWKRGSFGEHRPFWVERDTSAFSQHVFIHRYADGKLRPVWMSSALGIEVAQMELGRDGVLRLRGPDGQQTSWAWVNWGLTLVEDDAGADADADANADAHTDSAGDAATGEPGSLTLLAVGDNIAHTGVFERAWSPEQQAFDFRPIYDRVRDRVQSYDVAVVNQETILVADPAQRSDFPLFATPQSMGDALADAGFDVVLGATNHALDQGETGVQDTLAFWREQHPEVLLLGLHESPEDAADIDVVERNGIRLALFDYTYGLNGHAPAAGCEYEVDTLADEDALVGGVQEAERLADATVCFLHIGEEYATEPTAEQRAVVECVVAAGADVVVCTHPHVVQPVEELPAPDGGVAIVYWSLGNFMSNQMQPETVLGAAASLRFARGEDGSVHVAEHEALPLICHFDENGTWPCFLDAYTPEDAAAHYLNRDQTVFTLDSLNTLWDSTIEG